MNKKLSLFILLSTLSYSFVSLEPSVVGEEKGFNGQVAFSIKYNEGNSNSRAGSFSTKSQYTSTTNPWLIYLLGSYTYGESNKKKDTNDGTVHLRYIRTFTTNFDYEFFIQREFNEFQAIRERNLIGSNLRVNLFNHFFDKYYFGLGLFSSYLEPDTITIIDPVYRRIKMNSYISFLKKINDNFSITYLGYYQPTLENFNDFRIFQTLQLSTTLTQKISLSLDIWHQYNATPYHNIKTTDIRSRLSLRYDF